ncbi:DUF1549 and DUF1553 domain-containing protein [Tautonia plasticadhaerens]|uniref:BIG2 domain-containing protein n=1 Tax=Tautonia plasticadhaerens TaxID=2527974 RepID=A0A518GZG7_9BACT|nr:DUF1549 and DUF1553 domain-containing protein [Tautonia plasticadhaerens]QDV33979.1 hypothetical protein ElP_18600 [Tautonia plasticadhaerens]
MRSWIAATTIGLTLAAIGPDGLRAEDDAPAGASSSASPSLRAVPDAAVLIGPDAVQQLAVEGVEDGRDRTSSASFSVGDEGVAVVDASGMISARGDGETSVIVEVGGDRVEVPVKVRRFADPPPIHFANQVVPIFTKLGCNGGGCHGKSGGQNGFRLSLLGFEPELDYETLVKEGRGRRVFPTAPERSLLLTKAVAEVPHGGGKKLEPGSHEYDLIRRWIAEGMPEGAPDAPTVARIEVHPPDRVLSRGADQQLLVTAVYTDGATEDVTRWTQYESNVSDVAAVESGGRVRAGELPGMAAVMARYQGQVAVFRATVPRGGPVAEAIDFEPSNYVDELALAQWRELGLTPSDVCSDEEFIRRAALDITGTLPTVAEVDAFLADEAPDKRARLVDELLGRPEYAATFAVKWAEILRNKRGGNASYQRSTYRFYDWIRRQIDRNTPFDEFTRRILAASGTPETAPATAWYRNLTQPDQFVDDAAQVFLGMRLQCAKCHHHPFEAWSEDDYYGFAAFFGRVGRKDSTAAGKDGRDELVIFTRRSGQVPNPKTGQVMEPRGLGEPAPIAVPPTEDPRDALVDWLADPENDFFAPAVVNRYWAHFFSRGLVEPIDDLRATNPATNPALMEALCDDFVASGYDLKHLIRTICNSRLYGLSSLPNGTNADDTQSFARFYPKRMGAEVLLDAMARVTGVPNRFDGLPAGTRAIELPDESVRSDFLDTFGRPRRETACECERVGDASLSQSLMLLNSTDIQSRLADDSGRAAALAADPRPVEEKVEGLFRLAFGRDPSDSELATAAFHVESRPDAAREAFEDILWALVNAKEFQFID